MADVVKTCANCGNVQTTGDFCEKCGTRMPAAPAPAAPMTAAPAPPAAAVGGAAAAAYSAPRPSTPPPAAPPQYAPPQYAAPGQAAPQYSAPPAGAGAPPYGVPPAGPGTPSYDYARGKGFFGRLFDFSFQEFITPSIIKVLFIISMIVIGLGVLGGIIFGFMASAGTGVMFLIGGLIYGFLMLLYVRVILELFIVFFRIHDNTEDIAKRKR